MACCPPTLNPPLVWSRLLGHTVLAIFEFTFLVILDCGSRDLKNHNPVHENWKRLIGNRLLLYVSEVLTYFI